MNSLFQSHPQKPETYFLDVLWTGLERLYDEVHKLELAQQEKYQGKGARIVLACSLGNGPNDALITNHFVWYASSATCFLQLFDHAYNLGETYRSEFASMLKWRNKVAAHPAYVKPLTDDKRFPPEQLDSSASRTMSIMMSPEWDDDHYAIGGIIITNYSEGTNRPDSSHTDWEWALTHIHPKIERFVKENLPKDL